MGKIAFTKSDNNMADIKYIIQKWTDIFFENLLNGFTLFNVIITP